jgi:nitrite reductase/ring-hydroxylating ferredoxin subunit
MADKESLNTNQISTTTAVAELPPEMAQLLDGLALQQGAADQLSHARATVPARKIAATVPAEGADGVFSQSWFPICLASDIPVGTVAGFDFLDGRVVAWRDSQGLVHVTSAYCPHMGASLEAGEVLGDRLRCAFHHWQYDGDGRCVETAIGDPAPSHACLFVFPTLERWDIIWVFNGEAPLYQIPDFPFPTENLLFKTLSLPDRMPVDPWVQCANTPDIQHIKTLHRVSFADDPYESVRWTPHSMEYSFEGFFDSGTAATWDVGVFGTSLYYQSAWLDGRWFGFLVPMGLPRPGSTHNFLVLAVQPTDNAAEDERFLDLCLLTELGILGEDIGVLTTMRFEPGNLTRSDKVLGRFFEYLRAYPRAHPSSQWIR